MRFIEKTALESMEEMVRKDVENFIFTNGNKRLIDRLAD